MDFTTKLLGINAPTNMEFISREWSLRSAIPWWLALMFVLVLGMGVVVLYLMEQGTLGWIRRTLLILLRTALIGLIVLMLLRPVLLANFRGETARPIVVLLDVSGSMKQADRRTTPEDKLRVAIAKNLKPLKYNFADLQSTDELPKEDPTRIDMVKWMLTHPDLKLMENIEKHGPVRPMIFGTFLRGPDEGALLKEKGKIKKVDATAGILTVSADGKDLELAVPDTTRILGPDGQPLKTGLRDAQFKAEANVVFKSVAEKGKARLTDIQIAPKTVNEMLLASLDKAEDAKTALRDSINELLQKKGSELPAAIVIISDGQDNASKYEFSDIGKQCKDLQVPLYIYGVGTPDAGSLRLKEVFAPDTIFVDDMLPVMVRWAAQGFKKGDVEIEVKLGGKTVAKKDFPVKAGQDLRELLSFKVEKEFKKDEPLNLETTIRLKGSDIFTDKITHQVLVKDEKIRVLVIENSPRFEFHFLMPALDPNREKRFTTKFLLVNADPKMLKSNDANSPFIASLPPTKEKFFDAKYNVIILGDVPPSFLGKEQQEWIKEFVQNRGGLIVVAGRQNMPSQYVNSPLAEVLPVDFKAEKMPSAFEDRPVEYPPTLTEQGQRTDMLMMADTPEESLKIWQTLPGFFWYYPITKLRAGATSLVINPRAKMPQTKEPMPLIATQQYGQGQVLFCGTDETWRWRQNVGDKYFVRYWGQLIYQMGLPHLLGNNGKRALFSLEHAEAKLNRPSKIFVKLFDKEFNPRADEKVEAELHYLDTKTSEKPLTIQLLRMPDRKGEYYFVLPNSRAGRFELKLKNLNATETFSYRVEIPVGDELEEVGLNEKALRSLAKDSGGQFYREEDLYKLADDMKNEFTVVLDRILPASKEEGVTVAEKDKVIAAVGKINGMGYKEAETLVANPPKAVKENVSKSEAARIKAELESAGAQASIHERKVPFTVRHEVVLWNPLVMLIFVGLISAEWLVRKFSNLS